MSKILLILGNDKIARHFFYEFQKIKSTEYGISICIDASTNIKRIFRLIVKKRLLINAVLKMLYAEFLRKDYKRIDNQYIIKTNNELHELLKKEKFDKIYLFRAGLIINKLNLSCGVPFINTHCADVSNFGGLAAISKALKAGIYKQKACLHVVTSTIDDDSNIIDDESYILDPAKSYYFNEEVAYNAGIKLLLRNIVNDLSASSKKNM